LPGAGICGDIDALPRKKPEPKSQPPRGRSKPLLLCAAMTQLVFAPPMGRDGDGVGAAVKVDRVVACAQSDGRCECAGARARLRAGIGQKNNNFPPKIRPPEGRPGTLPAGKTRAKKQRRGPNGCGAVLWSPRETGVRKFLSQ